jgi:hypothetical protein
VAVFEQLQQKTWFPSPVAGFVGAVLGAFGLGIGVGKVLAGVKSWDWTLTVLDFVLLAFYTCWFAIAVVRMLPRRKAAE